MIESNGFLALIAKLLAALGVDIKNPALFLFSAVGALGALPHARNLGWAGMTASYIAGVGGSYSFAGAALSVGWIAPEFAGVAGFIGGLISMNVIAGIWLISHQFSKDPLGLVDRIRKIIGK